MGITDVFADYVSPREQIKSGVASVDIQCMEYRMLVIRDNGSPACVTEKTALKTGWQIIKPIFEIDETDILSSETKSIFSSMDDDKIQLYILAGQSNMEGNVPVNGINDLLNQYKHSTSIDTKENIKNIIGSWYVSFDDNGNALDATEYCYDDICLEWWNDDEPFFDVQTDEIIQLMNENIVGEHLFEPRDDVWIIYDSKNMKGKLTTGFGAESDAFGPELVLGELLGNQSDEQIVIVKFAEGGTTLHQDWCSPNMSHCAISNPDYYNTLDENCTFDSNNGACFKHMIEKTKDIMKNLKNYYPDYNGEKIELSGFVWFQGFNDGVEEFCYYYENDLINFIYDIRRVFDEPKLPVIISEANAANFLEGCIISEEQKNVAGYDLHANSFRTQDLSQFYHYDPAAQLIIGKRIHDALIELSTMDTIESTPDKIKKPIVEREFLDTVYAQKSLVIHPSRMESINSTDDDWCNYDYYVYDGKYNQLWIQQVDLQEDNLDVSLDKKAILTYLTTADFLYEEYFDLFGWEVLPGIPALKHVVCQDVDGIGTGDGGTFMNFDEFDDVNSDDMSQTYLYGSIVQESLHLWDFRGGIYLQGPDTAHSFTAAMEPIVHSSIGSGQAWWNDGADTTLPYDFIFNHWYKINLKRYLSDPQLNWETYYTDDAIRAAEYDNQSIPENTERMLLQGGLLMSIYQMHGKEGLKNVFAEIDQMIMDNPEWDYVELSPHQRNENFIKAVGDGLHIDATDYFDYWKYPISEQLRNHLSQYQASDKIKDNDGDGFSPIQGDFDDSDSTIYPGAPEISDGLDNNLDGLVDENVYRETDSDFTSKHIQIPALIQGSISELNDVDSFTFTLDKQENLAITIFSVSGDKNVREKINTYSGAIYLDDELLAEVVPDWFMAPAYLTIKQKDAGTYTLAVTANDENIFGITPNLGNYEIQIFANNHSDSRDMKYESLLEYLFP